MKGYLFNIFLDCNAKWVVKGSKRDETLVVFTCACFCFDSGLRLFHILVNIEKIDAEKRFLGKFFTAHNAVLALYKNDFVKFIKEKCVLCF